MKIWFTSDLHFSHRKVIEYCNRPFADVHEMNKGLTKIWNDTVQPNDIVYVIGDFSLNSNVAKVITPMLNGRKVLIAGNHDKCFKKPPKIDTRQCIAETAIGHDRRVKEYKNNGWYEVHQELLMPLKNGMTVLLSHLPYNTPASLVYDKRYSNLRPKDSGLVLLHGHLHAKYRKNGRMIDVGIDGSMSLLSEDQIIELINDPRDFIPSDITDFYRNVRGIKYGENEV